MNHGDVAGSETETHREILQKQSDAELARSALACLVDARQCRTENADCMAGSLLDREQGMDFSGCEKAKTKHGLYSRTALQIQKWERTKAKILQFKETLMSEKVISNGQLELPRGDNGGKSPPKADLEKLKELQELAAIERERALLQISIQEARRLPKLLESMDELEEKIEREIVTVEQRLMLYAAKQKILDSGRGFLADREEKFIAGTETTSRLEKMQREKKSPLLNGETDPHALNAVKRMIENAIRVRVEERQDEIRQKKT